MMQSESIQRYRSPSGRVIEIASRKLRAREEKSICRFMSSRLLSNSL